MGLFSGKYGNCPKCHGKLDTALDIAQKRMQRAANAKDFNALGSMMSIGGNTYFRCTRCGYVEERVSTQYGIVRREYKG